MKNDQRFCVEIGYDGDWRVCDTSVDPWKVIAARASKIEAEACCADFNQYDDSSTKGTELHSALNRVYGALLGIVAVSEAGGTVDPARLARILRTEAALIKPFLP